MGFVMGQSGHALGSVIAPKVKMLVRSTVKPRSQQKLPGISATKGAAAASQANCQSSKARKQASFMAACLPDGRWRRMGEQMGNRVRACFASRLR